MLTWRRQFKLVAAVASMLLLVGFVVGPVGAHPSAEPHQHENAPVGEPPIAILVLDKAVTSDVNQAALLESFATVFALSSNINNRGLLFYEERAGEVVTGSDFELRAMILQELALTTSAGTERGSDLAEALFQVHEYLDDSNALPGSRVIVVSNGLVEAGSENDLVLSAANFRERGWVVDVAITTGNGSTDIGYLTDHTQGETFFISTPGGFTDLLNHLYAMETVPLNTVLASSHSRGMNFITAFDVPPLTSSLEVLVYRENRHPFTAVQLILPSGETLDSDSFISLPNALIYRSDEVIPGRWGVQVEGESEGAIGVYTNLNNPIEMHLVNNGLPIGREFLLQASTSVNGLVGPLDNMQLFARLDYADMPVTTYQLVDDGTKGDLVADDGVFAALIPPLRGEEGDTVIELNAYWPATDVNFANRVDVPVLNFPEVLVERFNSVRVNSNSEWLLATVSTELNGNSYLVPEESIAISFEGSGNSFRASRIEPVDGNGEMASTFNIWGSPQQTGDYVLTVQLAVDYLNYQNFPISSSSEAQRIGVSALPPSINSRPSWLLGYPFWLPLLLPLVLIVLVLAVIKVVRLPRPFGYLTDSNGNLLVEFSGRRRRFLTGLFGVGKFSFAAVPGFETVEATFIFEHKKIKLNSKDSTDGGIRLNGIPCPPSALIELHDRDQLGIGGELVRVHYGEPVPAPKLGRELTEHPLPDA